MILSVNVIAFLNYMVQTKEFNEILTNFEKDYKGTKFVNFKESIKTDVKQLIKHITLNGGYL